MSQLHQAVTTAWTGDDQLLGNAHKPHASMAECIQVNVDAIREAALSAHVTLWEIRMVEGAGSIPIGYSVRLVSNGATFLYSYGIQREYRSAEVKRQWLVLLQEAMEDDRYIVSLYKVNLRAIGFFERHGFVHRHDAEDLVLLWQ